MTKATKRKRKTTTTREYVIAAATTTKTAEAWRSRLKAWSGPAWQRQLTERTTVSRVDEDIPTDRQDRNRKPWFIAVTQTADLLTEVGGVRGVPAGTTLLLSEEDVLALVRYLVEPQTVLWSEKPDITEPGSYEMAVFLQPGMVAISPGPGGTGHIGNGEAHWTPEFFKRQKPIVAPKKRSLPPKAHTLPWPMKMT